MNTLNKSNNNINYNTEYSSIPRTLVQYLAIQQQQLATLQHYFSIVSAFI